MILKRGDIISLGTCRDNVININVVRVLKIDKNNIYIGDVVFNKTLKNILKNNNITIFDFKNYFQYKGKCKYYNDNKSVELANNLFKELGFNFNCKGLLKIKINKEYKI